MLEEKMYSKDKVIDILKNNFDDNFKLDLISLARYSHKLIPNNIDAAEYIYSYIINSFPISNYKRQLNCLKNMIIERKKYLELSELEQQRYNFLKDRGRRLYRNCNLNRKYNYDMEAKLLYRKEKLEESYDYYLAGLYVTQHNIFNYYLGKMCYKNSHIDEAREYFEEYIKNGGEKLSKALLYLNRIYKIKKIKYKPQLFSERITELTRFFDNEFEFKNIPIIEDYYFEIESEDNIKNVSEDEIDDTKKDVDINLEEKLENIKNLILVHQDKKADKLILELEREKNNMNKEDKQILLQFQKNKKLYRSRR